jgi:hypothetical protein
MAIEIKKLIIKTTLVDQGKTASQKEFGDINIEMLQKRIMKECQELIDQKLDELQER